MKRVLKIACLFAALTSISRGADLHFVGPQDVDVVALLPPPPVVGATAAADLAAVLRAQDARSQADVARGKGEAKLTPAAFQIAIGPEFTPEHFPHTFALLEDAAQDSKRFSVMAKEHFARPRPALVDSRVVAAVQGDDEPSYPSGHATRGMLWALILSEIAPEKKNVLVERGQEIGWDRVVVGLHYPSDVFAGEVLGQALAQAMSKNADFQSRLAEAKEEFHAFTATHPVAAVALP